MSFSEFSSAFVVAVLWHLIIDLRIYFHRWMKRNFDDEWCLKLVRISFCSLLSSSSLSPRCFVVKMFSTLIDDYSQLNEVCWLIIIRLSEFFLHESRWWKMTFNPLIRLKEMSFVCSINRRKKAKNPHGEFDVNWNLEDLWVDRTTTIKVTSVSDEKIENRKKCFLHFGWKIERKKIPIRFLEFFLRFSIRFLHETGEKTRKKIRSNWISLFKSEESNWEGLNARGELNFVVCNQEKNFFSFSDRRSPFESDQKWIVDFIQQDFQRICWRKNLFDRKQFSFS